MHFSLNYCRWKHDKVVEAINYSSMNQSLWALLDMTHLCSVPHGAFYAWTTMARVQNTDDNIFMYLSVRPAPPPNQKESAADQWSVQARKRLHTWTRLARITWFNKKIPIIFVRRIQTHDFWSLSVLQLTLGSLLPVCELLIAWPGLLWLILLGS